MSTFGPPTYRVETFSRRREPALVSIGAQVRHQEVGSSDPEVSLVALGYMTGGEPARRLTEHREALTLPDVGSLSPLEPRLTSVTGF